MDDLLLFTPSKKSHIDKLGRSMESIVEKGTEDFAKEMSVVYDKFTIHG